MKVLANDGISKSGIKALEKGGFEVITTKVAQEQVANYINANNVSVLLVRSATKVRKDIIDACPGLKIIGRVDDVIITGGENLSLLAVENVISKYLPHLDFAVYVKENPEWGQQLFLVLAAGSNASENEMRELLEKELGEIAKPKGFIYLPSIPRSALGKVDRASLKRQVDDE
jgi:acyl-CoA synthetase (AMP-forming)/AMP-acid ligase II